MCSFFFAENSEKSQKCVTLAARHAALPAVRVDLADLVALVDPADHAVLVAHAVLAILVARLSR